MIFKLLNKLYSLFIEKRKAEILNKLKWKGKNISIGSYTLIVNPESLSIGNDTQIGDFTVLLAQNKIEIGSKCRISTSCMITSITHKIPSLDRHKDDLVNDSNLSIEIGDNVWIGANSVILPGTKIGTNSIIAAGSVVKTIIPENQIWGGVRAEFISEIRY